MLSSYLLGVVLILSITTITGIFAIIQGSKTKDKLTSSEKLVWFIVLPLLSWFAIGILLYFILNPMEPFNE